MKKRFQFTLRDKHDRWVMLVYLDEEIVKSALLKLRENNYPLSHENEDKVFDMHMRKILVDLLTERDRLLIRG